MKVFFFLSKVEEQKPFQKNLLQKLYGMCGAIFHYGQEAHDPRPMSHIHFGYPKALTKQKVTSIRWDANKMRVFFFRLLSPMLYSRLRILESLNTIILLAFQQMFNHRVLSEL